MLILNKISVIREERGIAFITVLLLLALTSALSLAFLQKASIGTSAVVSRGEAMQAHYLAESAANHALWRLLNDPSFSPSETVYTMHSLGKGRYGYKVRKPTLTKFGTVAAVGGVSNAVTSQSYVQYFLPPNIVTAYSKASLGTPDQRRLVTASWSDPSAALSIGSARVQWLVLKGCPMRKEIIMGTHDTDDDINFTVWRNNSWGDLREFTQNVSWWSDMVFDIAYENLSGDALVVAKYDEFAGVRYNVWNGSAWAFVTPAFAANLSPHDNVTYIDMASRPASDEILIAEMQVSNDLKVVQWNGAAFIDQGEIDTDTASDNFGSVEIVYEQQSGDALVLWGHAGSNRINYKVWSGASLSPVGQLPDFGAEPRVIRAAAEPNSDYIFVAAVDSAFDLNVAVWNGEAWIDSREISTSVRNNNGQVLDVAWEHSGEDVIVAWVPSTGDNVNYFSWRKGTSLADHPVQVGPGFQDQPVSVRLHPLSGTQRIILLANNDSQDLRYSLWSGNTFLGDPAVLLEADLWPFGLMFDVAESGVTYTGGSG